MTLIQRSTCAASNGLQIAISSSFGRGAWVWQLLRHPEGLMIVNSEHAPSSVCSIVALIASHRFFCLFPFAPVAPFVAEHEVADAHVASSRVIGRGSWRQHGERCSSLPCSVLRLKLSYRVDNSDWPSPTDPSVTAGSGATTMSESTRRPRWPVTTDQSPAAASTIGPAAGLYRPQLRLHWSVPPKTR